MVHATEPQLAHDYDSCISKWLEDVPEFFEEPDRIERD